jgi:hypothetical protein
MTFTLRGIIEFFRLVKREKELYREILALSISYNYNLVRIYVYYPFINENKTSFYYYLIHKFDFVALEGKEKWTVYKFTKNLYNI